MLFFGCGCEPLPLPQNHREYRPQERVESHTGPYVPVESDSGHQNTATGSQNSSNINRRPEGNETFREFYDKALSGDAKSQAFIGVAYEEGMWDVRRNYAKAKEWYLKSAAQGFTMAESQLGFMYGKGRGGRTDYDAARNWFLKAAKAGEPTAQRGLGYLYHNGLGVPQDHQIAAQWYRKAASQGDREAKHNLRLLQGGEPRPATCSSCGGRIATGTSGDGLCASCIGATL